jgi:Rrf2 family iron-sulfur cluster assembly transcriptional regulator
MLKLSRKTLLALEAVIDIAFNARPEPVQAKEITARQGVPQRYLEQVMQQLVRAGVLKGVRGPRGGYRLAKERRRISVGDVVRVAESIDDEEAENPSPVRTGRTHRDASHPHLAGRSDGAARRDLDRGSVHSARAAGVDCGGRNTADFII